MLTVSKTEDTVCNKTRDLSRDSPCRHKEETRNSLYIPKRAFWKSTKHWSRPIGTDVVVKIVAVHLRFHRVWCQLCLSWKRQEADMADMEIFWWSWQDLCETESVSSNNWWWGYPSHRQDDIFLYSRCCCLRWQSQVWSIWTQAKGIWVNSTVTGSSYRTCQACSLSGRTSARHQVTCLVWMYKKWRHIHTRYCVRKFNQYRAKTLGFIGRRLYFLGRFSHLWLSNGQLGRFDELPLENIPANIHACITI